ncbi:PucR family transcriptional regulator ligand-binding domain-containing protein [Actinosynnema sp. NPDC020468]|uniref:PucR family transcriptional regulator ligand-binding domain-containing protein n=1 Tax=Actinosynnema sp. NPDC020468 TaxID=3154488 RepID=UPI0033CB6DFF
MPLTVGGLADEVGLPVHVRTGLDRVVSWVHSTELADPTPFLEGGELLLTTGLALGPHDAYVDRLVRAGATGLGFGTGLSHDHVPTTLVDAARARDFPLVEVPRAIPFIAITKAVSRAVAADEYANLTRTSEAQHALTRAAVSPKGTAAVITGLAGLLDGSAALLDDTGAVVHATGTFPDLTEEVRRLGAGPAASTWRDDNRHLEIQALGRRGFLAVAATTLDPADRNVVNTAASLLTLALTRSDEVDAVRGELHSTRFALLLRGVPVPGTPTAPFRVHILRHQDAETPGFRALHDGRTVVLAAHVDVPAASSTEVDATSVARGYREALRAWQEGVDTFEEVEGSGLLSTDAAAFAEDLLAPLDDTLRDTLRVWLSCHGQWDPASARLRVHRHTTRNRVRKAEELLGRSLDSAKLRAELWFALHAPR